MRDGAMFSCNSGGKQYPWKPELAGKKAKCKCGAVLSIPAKPQAARAPARAAVATPAIRAIPVPPAEIPLDESQACPACKADLSPGSAICISCGYNLQTGEYVSTQVDTGDDDAEPKAPKKKKKKKTAAAAPAGAATGQPSATAWVGMGKTKKEREAALAKDKSSTVKQVTIVLILAVVVVGVIFGGGFAFNKLGNKNSGPKMPGQDAEALRMLQENQPMEAKAFIESHKSRMIGTQWTQAKAIAKIEQWYEMGAVKVQVPSDGLIARWVIIELPQDKAKREALINWQRVSEDENGRLITIKDEGQKYVIFVIP